MNKSMPDRRDCMIMAAMTIAYLAVALVSLGRLDVPETGWKPVRAGEGFVVDLGSPRVLGRVYYYSGLGDGRAASGRYRLEYMDGQGDYYALAEIEKKEIFIWKYLDVPTVMTARIRVTVDAPGGTLNELGFFEKGAASPVGGLKITGINADPRDEGRAEYLFDEQGSIEYPPSYLTGMIFDEIYHARTAYEHIHKVEPYETGHPPLGKDIIALGILVFGMVPFGWRIAGTLIGAMMVPAMYMFGRRLFDGRFYGFAAASLMMFDFMHFAQTRVATVDSIVTLFVILMYYFMYVYYFRKPYETGYGESLKPLFLSGLFFGLGAATKWNALYGAPGLALLFILAKYGEYKDYKRLMDKGARAPWLKDYVPKHLFGTLFYCVIFFVVIPVVIYVLAYIPFMMIPGPGHGLADIPALQAHMYKFHKTLVAAHPFQSKWWEWPLMLKPVWFYVGSDMPAGRTSTIVSLGNPAVWWAGIPAVFAAAVIAAIKRDRRMVVVFAAALSLYLPWTLVARIAFIYHFFPIVPFMILSIVYVLKNITERYGWGRWAAYGYLAVVALL
ncbi:MAG TPA: phospholipid carrier-dependent glycosyltransferase, partial [Nitrospirota bacterium]|nr:phospholipid carrier-dependent glycosyltransferase [Nitrospirota bacterium]